MMVTRRGVLLGSLAGAGQALFKPYPLNQSRSVIIAPSGRGKGVGIVGPRTALIVGLVAVLLGLPASTSAETVLVVGSSGYEPYSGGKRLLAFTQPKMVPAAAKPSARRHAPQPEVLAAINQAGLRYANHRGVKKVGLSALEWLALFRANIEIESAYNPHAQSHVGAFGLGQLMPETARMLGVDYKDMGQNLDGSARYLAQMLDQFGTKEYALAAYNAGPAAVEKYGGIPPYKETRGHVVKVVGVYQRIVTNGG